MKFKKQFPNIKIHSKSTEEFLMKHCLDKQRVKEVIEKINKEQSDNLFSREDYPGADEICSLILEELGLDK